jgi:phosphopantetheinyl transferase
LNTKVFQQEVGSLSIQRVLEFFDPEAAASRTKARVVVARHTGVDRSWSGVRAAAHDLAQRLIACTCNFGESTCSLCHDDIGAPYLAIDNKASSLNVSVAHCADWMAVGLASGAHIGVDVEFSRHRQRKAEISKLLGWQLEVVDNDDFHAKWTLWEASAKCVSGSIVERENHEFETLCGSQPGAVAAAGLWRSFNDQIDELFYAVAMKGGHHGPMMHRDLGATAMGHW